MWRPLSSRRLLLSLQFSSSSTTASPFIVRSSHFSCSSTYSSNAPSLSRRLEEQSRNVKVRVWWDFDTCKLPTGDSVLKVAPIITAALKVNGIKGPIEIIAFGNIWNLSRENQVAMLRTGIDFNHVPKGKSFDACGFIKDDIISWVGQNPPPSHLFLISGSSITASILHNLSMKNYNILVASIGGGMDLLRIVATITWHWNSLIRGENIIGNYCNFPPLHGFNDSCYDHVEAAREDGLSTFKKLRFRLRLSISMVVQILKIMCKYAYK